MIAAAYRAVPARLRPALPFLLVAALAVVVAGFVSAFLAHAPSRQVMWMVAYLILVAGVAQALLGLGRAHFAQTVPAMAQAGLECLAFNLANVGVIIGTLGSSLVLVVASTVLFALMLVWFVLATAGAAPSRAMLGYRLVLLLLALSACIGATLSSLRNLA